MKNSILLFFFISFVFNQPLFSQEIERNEVDEFTGKNIIETSWEPMIKSWSLYSLHRLRKVDDQYYFDFKMMTIGYDPFVVEEGEVLFFKFKDGEVLKLNNAELDFSGTGDGAIGNTGSNAMGIDLTFGLTNAFLEKLQTKIVTGIRLYTDDGYIEDKVKEKRAKKFRELMKLITK